MHGEKKNPKYHSVSHSQINRKQYFFITKNPSYILLEVNFSHGYSKMPNTTLKPPKKICIGTRMNQKKTCDAGEVTNFYEILQ